jgi:hypothetical protein
VFCRPGRAASCTKGMGFIIWKKGGTFHVRPSL